jgi:aryl-alcohol dehydrogenase-like predicted oxidoreductase
MQNKNNNLIPLGRTGVMVSRLGIGTLTWGDPSESRPWSSPRLAYGPAGAEEDQKSALDVSMDAGINFIDTAAMYGLGASERTIGKLTIGRDVVIATKFPKYFFITMTSSLPENLRESLDRLQRKTVDLYQVHYPFPWLSIPGMMRLMADAVEKGKVRAVGVSNFSARQMRMAHKLLSEYGIPLASNQVEYSLLHRKPEVDGVLETCRGLGVTLIAYMPLAMGVLTGRYNEKNKPAGLRKYLGFYRGREFRRVLQLVDLLRKIGDKYTKSPGQIALRWLLEQDMVIPIPGVRNGKQAEHNAGALSFALNRTDREAIDQVSLPWRR